MNTVTAQNTKNVFFADGLLLIGFGIHCTLKGMMLPYIKEEFMISYSQSGLLVTSSTVGFALSAVLSGKLSEKLGPVRLLTIHAALMALASLMILFAPSVAWIIAAFFLSGISYCGAESMSTSVIKSYSYPGREDKTVSSVFSFYMVGGMLASLLCYLILRTGAPWRVSYALAGAICMIAALAIRTIPERPIAGAGNVLGLQLKELFGNRVFLCLCIASAIFSGVETSTHNWIATVIRDGTPFEAADTYILLALFYLSITIGRVICTQILTRARTKDVVSTALFLSMVLLLALSYVGRPALVWVLTAAFGLCTSALYPMLISLTSGQADGGAVYSATFFAISIGNITTNALLGFIADAYSVNATFRFDGALLGVALVFVLLSELKKKKQIRPDL